MPRKRRVTKRRWHEVTHVVVGVAIDVGAWEAHFGGPVEGREAWEQLRARVDTNLGTRPGPFWAYEPGIPDELRALAYAATDPDPRSADGTNDLERRALRWLLAEGQDHLRAGETVVIQERLAELAAG
jgi:hypothetical protein